jgi:hypothetical protein
MIADDSPLVLLSTPAAISEHRDRLCRVRPLRRRLVRLRLATRDERTPEPIVRQEVRNER